MELNTSGSGLIHEPGHFLWSYSEIRIDATDSSDIKAEIIPARITEGHWNIVNYLEKFPCTTCLNLSNLHPSGNGTLLVDVTINHPFPGAYFTGFDVRGIPIFNGSYTFPASGLTAPDGSLGDGELVNPEGYTTLYNSSTDGMGPAGLQGYLKGKFATPTMPDAELNGYLRFVSNDVSNTRNAFFAGGSITRTYEIDMPDTIFVIGYAIDASWAPPVTNPVSDPIADFGPEANCPEPWQISVVENPIGDGMTPSGGMTDLEIKVYDWGGSSTHTAPMVECPDLWTGALPADFVSDDTGYSTWKVTLENTLGAAVGEYACLVSVEDNENDPTNKPWLDLTAYQVVNLTVSPAMSTQVGWVRTWGNTESDGAYAIDMDSSGNIYIIGGYAGTMDFDPGPGTFEQTSNGNSDCYLSRFDNDGIWQWTTVWGGPENVVPYAISLDDSGDIFVSGGFDGVADFDPGPGMDSHTSMGKADAFLSKFDNSGSWLWTKSWGDFDQEAAVSVDATHPNFVYVCGQFNGTVDFNPDAPVDDHTGNGIYDPYVSQFDHNGNFNWARTWGGSIDDRADSVVADDMGNVYIAARYGGEVDFDPGPGEFIKTATGFLDSTLTKLDSNGAFQWVRTWGGADGFAEPLDTATNGTGSIVITGYFVLTCDFDPGPGVDEHTSNGASDAYIVLYDLDGNYQWAETFGGLSSVFGSAINMRADGTFMLMTTFEGTIDADPGPGSDEKITNGFRDILVSRFDATGNYQWGRAFGSVNWDYASDVYFYSTGENYSVGSFQGLIDFDPGSSEEFHDPVGLTDSFLLRMSPDGDWQ
jgi:hypothetical protein